jgi:hypothetical protein
MSLAVRKCPYIKISMHFSSKSKQLEIAHAFCGTPCSFTSSMSSISSDSSTSATSFARSTSSTSSIGVCPF